MYFKISYRHNPAKNKSDSYYRLVESYRNETNRVCHRTLLNVGFLDVDIDIEQLNQIRRILCNRLEEAQGKLRLFDIEENNPAIVHQLVDDFWNRLVDENRIDIGQKPKKAPNKRQQSMVYEESIHHPDVRDVGAEWLCKQALDQLGLRDYLCNIGFKEEDANLALTQIIARAVYPASELETARWIIENSAVCGLTGYPIDKITKDKLYKSCLNLFSHKDDIENFLSHKTNELFDIEDKIYIYDLTNTYFEGRKSKSKLAKFGRSKEKRSDCKIVVLALVINEKGFIKYSNIFEGNMQDCSTLESIVKGLRAKTSTAKRGIVVMDAGIATEDNLQMLSDNRFDYVCVSRCKLKDYKLDECSEPIEVEDKKKQKIKLQKVISTKYNDFFLKVDSETKRIKEESMNNRFQENFEKGLKMISSSLGKKGGVKIEEKVYERVGRLKQKYPSISRHYTIDYKIAVEEIKDKKTKQTKEVRKVTDISWHAKSEVQINEQSGTYFLRTSLAMEEQLIWTVYNIIREVESTFRTLKTDLDLRPIYHKNDGATMAHLHLGLLAYWSVNTIRFQLKSNTSPLETSGSSESEKPVVEKFNFQWKEIVRIMNTQKSVLTVSQNRYDQIIISRRCSDPSPKVQAIYNKLHYKQKPYIKRKSVVHKMDFEKIDIFDLQRLLL